MLKVLLFDPPEEVTVTSIVFDPVEDNDPLNTSLFESKKRPSGRDDWP